MITTFPNSRAIGKTLLEWLPREARNDPNAEQRLTRHYGVKVIAEFSAHSSATGSYLRWPGTHKNVVAWVVLENGLAVGWNENGAIGWSFPSMKLVKQPVYKYRVGTDEHPLWLNGTAHITGDPAKATLFTWAESQKLAETNLGDRVSVPNTYQFCVGRKRGGFRPLFIASTNVQVSA